MTIPNIDDVAQTLAEYERLAISTGATVQIMPTEFSTDGMTWVPFWIESEPPVLARATVLRDGIETVRVQVWAESLPAEDSWRNLWMQKPTKLFGAYADRAALRRAFRDAIGDRREPDEQTPPPETASARDWEDEIEKAETPAQVTELHAEMKTARAVTVVLERALRTRLTELGTAKRAELAAQRDTRQGVSITDAVADEVADSWKPVDQASAAVAEHIGRRTPPARRTPKDHLPPANRAARRAASSKKGRRR